jgi:hypothetical protein
MFNNKEQIEWITNIIKKTKEQRKLILELQKKLEKGSWKDDNYDYNITKKRRKK